VDPGDGVVFDGGTVGRGVGNRVSDFHLLDGFAGAIGHQHRCGAGAGWLPGRWAGCSTRRGVLGLDRVLITCEVDMWVPVTRPQTLTWRDASR
jgi:hypothetical protein